MKRSLPGKGPFRRRGDGPLMTIRDLPFAANAVLNPGAALADPAAPRGGGRLP